MRPSAGGGLHQRLNCVLRGLDERDARLAFEAIRLAQPAGLGRADRHDVALQPTVGLLEAMVAAQARDRIAYQYANGYEDVFLTGVPCLKAFARRWARVDRAMEWATVACYLAFLATLPDTHIRRKFGRTAAEQVRRHAEKVETKFKACENPNGAVPLLLNYDKTLKWEGLNPGTSADLTVASLLALHLEFLLVDRCRGRVAETTAPGSSP
jgi:triphosphoribosyl-dephospho-CoA synthase